MLAKYKDEKYTLTYLQGSINKIRVDVERRVKKGGIEALGFCSSNYNKTVIKNELVEIIPLKRTMESRGMLMQVLKDLIEEEGYAEARKDFDINVFKGLVTKLFKEACKEQKVEYLTNSDVFFTHKNKVVGWIRNGMPKNEVISKFNEEYGTELNNYYYGLARREALKC